LFKGKIKKNSIKKWPKKWTESTRVNLLKYLFVYLTNKDCLSTCLDIWQDLGLFICAMDQLLSHYKAIGLTILQTTPNSMINFLTQTSFYALDVEIYLDSIVKLVVIFCLELFQLTTPLFRVKTYIITVNSYH